MVGPRLLYGYATDGAAATADSTASGYSAVNAVPIERVTTWKSGGTTAQRLMLQSAAAFVPTGLGICGGNYSAWGVTKLQWSDDGTTWTTHQTLGGLPGTNSTQDYFSTVTGAPSKSRWALRWDAPTAAPEVALFYLGTLVTLSDSYTYPYEEADKFGVDVQVSEGEIVQSEEVARVRARFLLNFGPSLLAAKEQARTVLRSEGGPLRPFFFVPIDETGSSVEGRAYLVRYQPGEFAWRRIYALPHEFALPLLEEV